MIVSSTTLRHYSINLLLTSLAICLIFFATPLLAQDGDMPEDGAPSPARDMSKSDMDDKEESPSRITDEVIPLQTDKVPDRPRPLLEIGDGFLETGELFGGIDIPGGAVWRPRLIIFGTGRSAIQRSDSTGRELIEWANSLELFANLYLTETERFLFSVDPFARDTRFSGYRTGPKNVEGGDEEFNAEIQAAFFEGDLGEMFPFLDISEDSALDFGISAGRQFVGRALQGGFLINDRLDAVSITRNSVRFPHTSNVKMSLLYAWGDIERDDYRRDQNANLFALLTSTDFSFTSLDLDVVYVDAHTERGDAFYSAVSATQRFGHLSSTFRFASSYPLQGDSSATAHGHLLFAELSWPPAHTHNIAYFNAFWGIDNFSSAARDPRFGGPLASTGILWEAPGLGRIGEALSSDPKDAVGASAGYQAFFGENRYQLVFEIGGRSDADHFHRYTVAAGIRYQMALGQRYVIRADQSASIPHSGSVSWISRLEFLVKF